MYQFRHIRVGNPQEILIEFTDGTLFSTCLKTSTAVEAKLMRRTSDEAELLKYFSTSAQLAQAIWTAAAVVPQRPGIL